MTDPKTPRCECRIIRRDGENFSLSLAIDKCDFCKAAGDMYEACLAAKRLLANEYGSISMDVRDLIEAALKKATGWV
jgi:hypothetical protein